MLLSAAQLGATSPEKQPRYAAPKQPAMRATQLKSLYGAERKEQLAAKAAAASPPSKALEPKVLVPFKPAPGEVPRRIVIERQKRLFALQDLASCSPRSASTLPCPTRRMRCRWTFSTTASSRRGCRSSGSRWPRRRRTARCTCPRSSSSRPPSAATPRYGASARSRATTRARIASPSCTRTRRAGPPRARACRGSVCASARRTPSSSATASSTRMPRARRPRRVSSTLSMSSRCRRRRYAAAAAQEPQHAAEQQSSRRTQTPIPFFLFVLLLALITPTLLLFTFFRSAQLPPIEKERIARMLGLALNSDRLLEQQQNASSVIAEVSIDYARTMAQIIFRQRAEAYTSHIDAHQHSETAPPSADMIFAGFALPPPPSRSPCPELAVVEIPDHDYGKQRKEFCFNTFLSKPEIIFCCTHKIRTECNKVLELSLLTTQMTKPFSDEEFAKEQQMVTETTVDYLKIKWMTDAQIDREERPTHHRQRLVQPE